MVKGYVKGGLCRPLFLLNSVVLFLFFAGRIQHGDETGPDNTEARPCWSTNKTPVVRGSSLSLSGKAGTLNNRGFLFSFFAYPCHAFG